MSLVIYCAYSVRKLIGCAAHGENSRGRKMGTVRRPDFFPVLFVLWADGPRVASIIAMTQCRGVCWWLRQWRNQGLAQCLGNEVLFFLLLEFFSSCFLLTNRFFFIFPLPYFRKHYEGAQLSGWYGIALFFSREHYRLLKKTTKTTKNTQISGVVILDFLGFILCQCRSTYDDPSGGVG